MTGQTPEKQQNWQSSENHNIIRKNTILNEHPVWYSSKNIISSDCEEGTKSKVEKEEETKVAEAEEETKAQNTSDN